MFITLIALLFSSLVTGMENSEKNFSFSLAINDDKDGIVDLINTQAMKDADKIVILPKDFRHNSITNAIEKKRLFVARDLEQKEKIVAFKKLFVLNDINERNEIMESELRCIGNKSERTFSGIIKNGVIATEDNNPTFGQEDLYLYNGGDFTHPEYRKKGLNEQLSRHAFSSLVSDKLIKQSPTRIHLLFGLVHANSGTQAGAKGDRAIPLASAFSSFVKEFYPEANDIALEYYRYKAFMPTFDPTSSECKPLPDEKAIPGYGCVLTYENSSAVQKSGKVQE